jgi:hypothetical protein
VIRGAVGDVFAVLFQNLACMAAGKPASPCLVLLMLPQLLVGLVASEAATCTSSHHL